MLKVVIVEDEFLVNMGMRMCLEQTIEHSYVIESFSNAEEAFIYLDQFGTDILITDIRLTGCSGLDLIEKLEGKLDYTAVLVLSCYEDFSYARRAFELGADKYILKHELKEDELGDVVHQLYIGKIKGRNSNKNVMPLFPKLESKENNEFALGLIYVRRNGSNNTVVDEISIPMLSETINTMMNLNHIGDCYIYQENNVLCFFSFEKDDSQDRDEIIYGFLNDINKQINIYFNRDCQLIVTDYFDDVSIVQTLWEQLVQAQKYMFYILENSIVKLSTLPIHDCKCDIWTVNSTNMFSIQWQLDFAQSIDKFIKTQVEKMTDPTSIKIQIDSYFHFLVSQLDRGFGITLTDVFTEEEMPSYIEIEKTTNYKELYYWTMHITEKVCMYIQDTKQTHPLINKILLYLSEHYTEQISLEIISSHFYLNTTYFCKIFKKHTGENFISYLNKLRIEKAIKLLKTTDLSVEKISEAVGVQNSNYFFRLFKKVTGETISHYRKR